MKTNYDVDMTLLCNFRYLLPMLEVVKFLSKTILRKLWHELHPLIQLAIGWHFLPKITVQTNRRTDEFQMKHFKVQGVSSDKSGSYSRKMFDHTGTAIATSSTYNMFKLVCTAESLVKSRLVRPSVSTIICIDTCHENSNVSSLNKNIMSKPFWHYT